MGNYKKKMLIVKGLPFKKILSEGKTVFEANNCFIPLTIYTAQSDLIKKVKKGEMLPNPYLQKNIY